ncbi:HD domain-containing protein [Patescibacteria group bacterium]|nr:HD domain-containing protein [Patescibacteria group bacterium]
MNIIEKAGRIAIIKHKDQKRKNDGFPYIIHPFMVANKLAQHGFGDKVIAAGLVHDVLEDSDTSRSELVKDLGEDVVSIIDAISEDMDLEWEIRKEQYAKDLKEASVETKAVSVADKIHNMGNMLETYKKEGEDLWKKFGRGKEKKIWFEELVLQALKDSWEHPLVNEYEDLIKEFKKLD